MKKKIVLKRLLHRELMRIAIMFGYDEKLKSLVKSIPGAKYSSTNKCFYLDDSEENLKKILVSFKDVADIDISSLSLKEMPVISVDDQPSTVRKIVKNFPAAEAEREIRKIKADDSGKPGERYGPVEFRISENEGLLVIKFTGRYDKSWVDELISYPGHRYDKLRKEWLLPWTQLTSDSLADFFTSRSVMVKIVKQVISRELKSERQATADEVRSRPLSEAAINGLDALSIYLDENRYSPRTRVTYLAALEFFLRYFSDHDPFDISGEEISRFIYNIIIRLGYSSAYQNQMISAVKTFYYISGRGKVNPELLVRPRKSRALPKVLSKDEVGRVLNAARNPKHKLLLWLIYSCGLRRSEASNLKPEDFDRGRNLLHIREGKGMVERVVPVSPKVWDKLDEYLRSYKPGKYLFEGQSGGKYSNESVYRVFKDAMQRAGIKKDVGVHALRHSYATHLHESGLDIRYIQELLGHKSTRTTEIYTHVSRRNLIQVRSPIEDIDVK
jgi:integrase/recombinase XerD